MRQMLTNYTILGLAFGTTAALLAGCPDRSISEVNPDQGRVEYKDIPVSVNRNIDILFMVDNSNSMKDKQANLKANFPEFINVLSTIQGGLPDLHIGVISSDMGSKGLLDATGGTGAPGCQGNGDNGKLLVGPDATGLVSGNFISDIQDGVGGRTKNYTGDLATAFGKMATLGDQGCGFEQQLASMKAALSNNPSNANFLRPDAYLAVIFITDEDDCSFNKGADMLAPDNGNTGVRQSFRCTRFGVTCDQGGADPGAMNQVGTKGECHPNNTNQLLSKVDDYVTFLKGLKTDPGKVIVAGIMGTLDPFAVELRPPPGSSTPIPALAHSCTYQGASGPEVADPPVRLKYFLDQFPSRSTFSTICDSDLTGGLQTISQLLKTVIGDPCIEGKLADVDPRTDGPQYDCSVSDVAHQGLPNETESILAKCNAGNTNIPCWHIDTDPVQCTGGDHFILKVERGGTTPPPDTHEIAYCVTEK